MLGRFTTVIASVLSAVWLARAPDWEPLIALLTLFFGYLGVEIVHYRKQKQKSENSDHKSVELDIAARVHRLIDRMEQRRHVELVALQNSKTDQKADEPWYKKPIGIIVIGVTVAVLAAIAKYLLGL